MLLIYFKFVLAFLGMQREFVLTRVPVSYQWNYMQHCSDTLELRAFPVHAVFSLYIMTVCQKMDLLGCRVILNLYTVSPLSIL